VAAVYGLEVAAALLDVVDPPVRGLLAPPSLHRASRDQLTILVNRRCIQHRSLAFAVEQAYRGLREPDRSPIAILGLELDPADVDVNVHPTKREVRFRNEGAVFQALERACYRALRRSGLYTLAANSAANALQIQETPAGVAVQWTPGSAPDSAHDMDEAADSQSSSTPSALRLLPDIQYVGQVLNAYLVAQSGDALVLIDQHAAHERVLFDRLRDRLQRGDSPGSQLLLVPQLVEVSAEQAAIVEEQRAWIEALGFGLEPFGTSTVRLSAVPAGLPEGRAADLLSRILEQLARNLPADLRLRETAALLACHTAVRFGDALTAAAAQALLRDLAVTAEPISCPHGRPTTLVLPDGELRRLFKRP
jgi:DNA mismatch repair protein MutL